MTSQPSPLIEYLRRVVQQDDVGLTDGQLLGCFIEHRDEAAFAALVKHHGRLVWNVCRRLLGQHDAEDAFQATFLMLVRKAASIRRRERLASWLYGVAHRTALQARRTVARRRAREKQVVDMPEPAAVEQEVWNDLQPLLDQELSRLPEGYQVVLLLCDLEGKTRKEVARQLRLPEGTVASRLARARTMLAKRLARHGLTMSSATLAVVLSDKAMAASVPTSVVSSTIKAVTLVAAGQAAATGAISVKVVALTEGVLKTMLLTRLKIAALVMLLIAVVSGGAGLLCQVRAAAQSDAPSKTATQTPPTALDEVPQEAQKVAEFNKAVHLVWRVIDQRTAAKAAEFEYPKARKLEERAGHAGIGDSGAIYQSLCTTTDDLAKVAAWYDRKLAGLIAGQAVGVTGGPEDGDRRAVNQDGGRPELHALMKRPASTRSYLVRTKSYTVAVVISRPPGETLTVISVTLLPE